MTYTLADAPPEALGLSSAAPTRQPADAPTPSQQTVDKILATPQARAKLHALLPVVARGAARPTEFTIDSDGLPRVHAGASPPPPSRRRARS